MIDFLPLPCVRKIADSLIDKLSAEGGGQRACSILPSDCDNISYVNFSLGHVIITSQSFVAVSSSWTSSSLHQFLIPHQQLASAFGCYSVQQSTERLVVRAHPKETFLRLLTRFVFCFALWDFHCQSKHHRSMICGPLCAFFLADFSGYSGILSCVDKISCPYIEGCNSSTIRNWTDDRCIQYLLSRF